MDALGRYVLRHRVHTGRGHTAVEKALSA